MCARCVSKPFSKPPCMSFRACRQWMQSQIQACERKLRNSNGAFLERLALRPVAEEDSDSGESQSIGLSFGKHGVRAKQTWVYFCCLLQHLRSSLKDNKTHSALCQMPAPKWIPKSQIARPTRPAPMRTQPCPRHRHRENSVPKCSGRRVSEMFVGTHQH